MYKAILLWQASLYRQMLRPCSLRRYSWIVVRKICSCQYPSVPYTNPPKWVWASPNVIARLQTHRSDLSEGTEIVRRARIPVMSRPSCCTEAPGKKHWILIYLQDASKILSHSLKLHRISSQSLSVVPNHIFLANRYSTWTIWSKAFFVPFIDLTGWTRSGSTRHAG